MINPAEDVKGRKTLQDNHTINEKEYKDLLSIIKPENGNLIKLGGKRKKSRNWYRPYLKVAIELALHSGGRREEIIMMSWDKIGYIDGEPSYIQVSNFKVERSLGAGFNENVPPKIIPITADLLDLLIRIGYHKKRDTDGFILELDRTSIEKETLMDNISKGFTHFYKLLETGRKLEFKHLRKTYLTYMKIAMGIETKELSSHATDEIIDKHYVDKKVISTAQQKFRIFKR